MEQLHIVTTHTLKQWPKPGKVHFKQIQTIQLEGCHHCIEAVFFNNDDNLAISTSNSQIMFYRKITDKKPKYVQYSVISFEKPKKADHLTPFDNDNKLAFLLHLN